MSSYTKRCWRQEIQAELEVWSIPYFSDLSILTTSAPNAKLKRKIKFFWWYEKKTKLPTWYSMASQDTVWVSGIHHFRIQKKWFLRRSYSWCLIRSWYEQLGVELFVWIADAHLNFIPRPNHRAVTYIRQWSVQRQEEREPTLGIRRPTPASVPASAGSRLAVERRVRRLLVAARPGAATRGFRRQLTRTRLQRRRGARFALGSAARGGAAAGVATATARAPAMDAGRLARERCCCLSYPKGKQASNGLARHSVTLSRFLGPPPCNPTWRAWWIQIFVQRNSDHTIWHKFTQTKQPAI